MCGGGIGWGEATEVGELRRCKSGGSARLKGTTEKQLGGEKRREIHIESRPGGSHLGGGLIRGRGIDGRDIRATRAAVRKPLQWDGVIGTVGTVGETRIVCVQMRVFGGGRRRGRDQVWDAGGI